MRFLSGELGSAIRGILATAATDTRIELYCALFELDLDDLVAGLAALGPRAHVILGNGSVAKPGGDENAAAAARLQAAGVDLHRRMVAPKGLAHNKTVAVVIDGKPFGVWSGSTNWTMTGLHTQMNNGIAIEHAELAQAYLDQWQAIRQAENSFTPDLKRRNAQVKGPFKLAGGGTARVWFTPNAGGGSNGAGPDIDDLVSVVQAARQGILLVMFMPGPEPLNTILKRRADGLYVRGVVSTLPMGSKDHPSGTYSLLTGDDYKSYAMDIVQPEGVDASGDFLATFTRSQFLAGMGFAITHTKVLVIDPFGDHPVVVTGSHNFSSSASEKNDENLIIIEGCPRLAQAYAVNCMGVYKHYRWPASQQDARQPAGKALDPSGYLDTTDAWQKAARSPDALADLDFWQGRSRQPDLRKRA
jgi:phosphatidylserine/phosphatidylglycerophosphate/cardiolipin synthase-like enzyme